MININNLIFSQSAEVKTPLRIFFLCGSIYRKKSYRGYDDKREVMKAYIESYSSQNKVLILEEKFGFRRNDQLLNYNEIGLKSLKDIEILTSMLSTKTIILHESLSTAAEIGLFSGNTSLLNKMVILTPDYYLVEEDFITGFLELVYNNSFFQKYNIEIIRYYPKVFNIRESDNVRKYYSYFIKNKIPESLKINLNKHLMSTSLNAKIVKNSTKTNLNNENLIYKLHGNKVSIKIHPNLLISYLFSLIGVKEVWEELSKGRKIYYVINKLEEYFKTVLLNTLINTTGFEDIELEHIEITSLDIELNSAIGYFSYILVALKFIELPVKNSENKIKLKNELRQSAKLYENLLSRIADNTDLLEVLED